jgi:hypothetical protein
MTKTEIRMLAQESTSYGYFDHGATLSINCPRCRTEVVAHYSMWVTDDKGKRMSKVQQLRAAVADHLTHECGP